jgi:hypothetical protein
MYSFGNVDYENSATMKFLVADVQKQESETPRGDLWNSVDSQLDLAQTRG